jgi:formylglycine-generating enzyme required for sulfatase activity
MKRLSGEWIGGLLLCGWVLALAGCGSSESKPDPPLEAPFSKKTFSFEMAPGVTMDFVAIPPGRFMMGGGASNLKPRKVSLCKPYYLGKYEVTQQQWMTVMNKNPSAYKDDPKMPVQRLEWDDCKEFLRRMNQKFGQNTGMQFSLPTEAKWEYACRAGTGESDAPGVVNSYAWKGKNIPQAVGQMSPNAWGLYDMQGNVAEWCADWIDAKGNSVFDGEMHVVRGGNWREGNSACTSRARVERRATVPLRLDGMRLVCMPR